jgi:hypothetical protein
MSYEILTVIALLCQRSMVYDMKYAHSGTLQSECQIKMVECVEKREEMNYSIRISKCIKEGLTK